MLAVLVKSLVLRYKHWILGYIGIAVLAGIVILIFFRSSTYPMDQVAVVISIPILVLIAFWKLPSFFLSSSRPRKAVANPHEVEDKEKALRWFVYPGAITMMLFLLSLTFAVVMSISSAIYSMMNIGWAFNIIWFDISINAFIVAAASLCLLLIVVGCFIIRPYWHRIFVTIRERCRLLIGLTGEVRINGYKLPTHWGK